MRPHKERQDTSLRRGTRLAVPSAVALMAGVVGVVLSCAAASRADEGLEFFEKKVRPVLVEHCYSCHSAEAKELHGELRLDLQAGWKLGGESRQPAVVPGKPDESALIRAVRHDEDASAMPPGKPRLSDQVVADLATWVRMGAPDPREGTVTRDGDDRWKAQFQDRLDWWSLRPVADVAPPEVAGEWPRDAVDRFILRQLQQHWLSPAADADPLTLLRRLSFVLTGLPPASELVHTFPARYERDPDAALEAIVDQFLQSPHFGERIARHWMDVVRYTDTYGYEWDNPAKGSWEYRDYLIRAFNKDIGFDHLMREQIAGDLLATPRSDPASGFHESLIGPMFYHMGEHRHGDNEVINGVREEMIDNKIDAFSKAFLAMTVACARCHDHKLDAISQKDYYALAGVFMMPRWTSRTIDAPEKNAAKIEELRRLRSAIRERTATLWAPRAEELAAGDSLRQAAGELDRAQLAQSHVGDVEWLLHQLLSQATDEATTSAWQQLVSQWRTTSEERRLANAKFTALVDFSGPGMPEAFAVDGDGMRTGYAAGGEPLIALEGDVAIERLLPRGLHTHALSSKLPGALRLPRQEDLPGSHVNLALAGDQWSGYLRISDNAFQTENVTFLSQPQSAWITLADIAPTNGLQRVAYEIATSDLNPNFPPRTGLARAGGTTLPPQDEGFDKRSWFSVTGIVSHDQPGQPLDDLQRFASLFADPPPTGTKEAWQRVGGWLARSVARCQAGPVSGDDVLLVNWLLARGLLPNRLAEDSELAALVKQYRDVEGTLPFPRTCNSMDERGVAPLDYALNIRGDINRRGQRVPRGLPQFAGTFGGLSSNTAAAGSPHSGRLELAEFLADPRHGLAARVYVNRVWQWVFGDGLVRTPNDFGHLGEQPSHPELLDYLTREFIAGGWSTKRLIRRLVLSRTFRQSGAVSAQAAAVDPANRWLHHYPTRRLEAEAIRDALLAVSGQLDRTLYGRPINPQRQVEDAAKRLFSGPLDGNGRRSIYLEVSIMDRSKFLQSFNAPDPKLPTGRRDETNVPAQALVMLNDPLVLAMADHWSSGLVADGSPSVEDRVRAMFVRALGRRPEADELARWAALVENLSTGDRVLADRAAWKHAAHTLFNLQEFTHCR
ncbi:MAG: PSD1 domain-containing protein [Pirellulaceae bacterium]|nr:PSD1 domain-containing protein [Pirellulaceae bacterium]